MLSISSLQGRSPPCRAPVELRASGGNWYLMGRPGDCAAFKPLKRTFPDMGHISEPERFVTYLRSNGPTVRTEVFPVQTGKAGQALVPDKGLTPPRSREALAFTTSLPPPGGTKPGVAPAPATVKLPPLTRTGAASSLPEIVISLETTSAPQLAPLTSAITNGASVTPTPGVPGSGGTTTGAPGPPEPPPPLPRRTRP